MPGYLRRGGLCVAVLFFLCFICVSCGCGAGGEGGDDDTGQPQIEPFAYFEGPTACDDFLAAEHEVETGTFSNAYLLYRSAIDKLTNGVDADDGSCPPETLNRARYGASLMLLTLPLRIIEGFVESWLAGDDHAVYNFLVDWYRETHGDGEPPVSLITDYLTEIVLPLLDEATDWMDHVLADTDFSYAMPTIKIELFGQAFVIPDVSADGRGEHDLGEAALLAWIYRVARFLSRSVYAYNLDIDAENIDAILQIFMSGDFSKFFELAYEYPDFLKLREDDASGIDGRAELMRAKRDLIAAIQLIADDDNSNGIYRLEQDGHEKPDDFLDAVQSETDDQSDDIFRYESGRFSCNFRVNGKPADEAGCGALLDVLFALLSDRVLEKVAHATFGMYPPEADATNGFDDDFGMGYISELDGWIMKDYSASWEPGALIGKVLTPDVFEVYITGEHHTYTIIANTTDTLFVSDDMTSVAAVGDMYSIGDGEIDDAPMDISSVLALILQPSWPSGGRLALLISALYDLAPDVRDYLPAWDPEFGDPEFYGIVVDRTESFEDTNGNGFYDPGVDILHDAPHSFGEWSYPEDGLYQPYYMFFPDPTISGSLVWGGTLENADPNDALNMLISALIDRFAPPGGKRCD